MLKKFPDTLTLIFTILIFCLFLTWIIPAGEFDRVEMNGRKVIVPGTYHKVEQNPQILQIFVAPIKGFVQQAEVIGFILLIGGVFYIINFTGSINAALFWLIEKTKKSKLLNFLIIPILMTCFSIGGSTFGMAEETLVFILITIPMAIAMGYDAVVGLSIAFIGAAVGFAGAFFNPFTVGIAQGIAGLSPFSGLEYRLLVWLVFTLVGIIFVMVYAKKIKKNPSLSIVADIKFESISTVDSKDLKFNTQRIIILCLLALSIVLLAIGVQQSSPEQLARTPDFLKGIRSFFINLGLVDWYIQEIAAIFLGLGLFSGLIYKMKVSEIVNSFWEGVKEMVIPAVLVAFAKGILVIAEDGKIIDTILFGVSNAANGLPRELSVQIMFLVQGFINTFVPSGSGQAALTMPIMAPLSDVLGFSRQTAVLAFQFGDGITNMIIPTSAVLMGVLQIAKIPYERWFKFILPLIIILYLISFVFLYFAVVINYV